MKIITVSQKNKQGSAAHFANSRLSRPAMIGNHSGNVCTSCRSDPGGTLTAPTTYNAATMASEEYAMTFGLAITRDYTNDLCSMFKLPAVVDLVGGADSEWRRRALFHGAAQTAAVHERDIAALFATRPPGA